MTLTPSAAPEWVLLDLDQTEQEYELFDSVICERTDIGGFPIQYYIKLNPENSDYLYGEDTISEYTDPYRTKLLYEPTEEPQILNVFGMTSDDTIQYMQIPKTIFNRDVTVNYEKDYKVIDYTPKVGDCILTLWNDKIYEIAEVGSEQKIFQAKKMIWEFIVKPYRHSEESDSAHDMLFDQPPAKDFPDINITTETDVLSAYGENAKIENESDSINTNVDSSVYGF